MTPFVGRLRSDTKVRYLFVGGTGFLIELLIIFLAQSVGLSGTVAVAISFIVGLGYSFVLQKLIAFEDKRTERTVLAAQIAAYAGLIVFNFIFTVTAVALLDSYLPVELIRAGTLAVTVIWNYYLYKTWIFNHK